MFGDIIFDIVVLNVGICEYVDLFEFDFVLFKCVFEVNFFGIVNCIYVFLFKCGKNI